ncbi:MAG TPA: hypothetical protein PLN55_11485 [Burkholderiaceae bacterium]|nr:hypothetical protein [Burkholderiaceae bacterium]
MAFTTTQYQAICDAIASGELRVRYDGKEVEYRTMSDLTKAKAAIEAELIATGQLAPPLAGADGVARGGTTWAAYCPD